VGVGAPGIVRPGTGQVGHAPNLPGFDSSVPLGARLAEVIGVPVLVENDVNAAIVGEQRSGAAVGHADVLGVWMGTGVGAGLILDGELRRGPRGVAGEIGHIVVRPGGRPCGCGGLGHLEAYAGRRCMEAEARRRHAAGEHTLLVELAGEGRMKSGVFSKALAKGDAVAVELIDEAVAAMGVALAAVVMLVDVTLVVVGGGLAEKLGDSLVASVAEATTALLPADLALSVVSAALGDDSGAIGAAALARAQFT
jgi:glucokinase